MKRLLLLAGIAASCGVFAQQPLNPDFENWTIQTLYEEVDSMVSTNNQMYLQTQTSNVKKVTSGFHGTYAAELTTIATTSDTTFGGLFIGTPGPGGISGGIPYTGQPDSISAYVKYNIQPGDTGIIIIGFKKNGTLLGFPGTYVLGTQTSWERISFATNLPPAPAPDTMFAIIISSKFDAPRYPGSMLTIDSITLMNTSQPFPNNSFEDWTAVNIEEPDDWFSINVMTAPNGPYPVVKSTDSYSGTYSCQIDNILTPWGDTLGFITNGRLGANGPEGGMATWMNPAKVTGYYKYAPVGSDTALGMAISYKNQVAVDSNQVLLPATSVWTYFEMPLAYNGWPISDTLNIAFAAGNPDDNYSRIGSRLMVDSINVVYHPAGIDLPGNQLAHSLYPNPMKDIGILEVVLAGASYDLVIRDVSGKTVIKEVNITDSRHVIDASNLEYGVYSYTIQSNGQLTTGKLIRN